MCGSVRVIHEASVLTEANAIGAFHVWYIKGLNVKLSFFGERYGIKLLATK